MKNKMNIALLVCIYRLGISNVLRVIIYRLAIKAGYYRLRLPVKKMSDGEIFGAKASCASSQPYTINYYSKHPIQITGSPDWFSSPWKQFDKKKLESNHWSEIADFNNEVGDIKAVWELSRFDWAPQMAWEIRTSPNPLVSEELLECWLRSWISHNPANQGINWKCAQEASLRVLNVLLASKILGEKYEQPSDSLLEFYQVHIERILPTMHYAKAQDNNHGTSEAIALFCVGSYLKLHGKRAHLALSHKALKKGRNMLENRVKHLISNDGSFSQNSLTYHRLMLDTVCFCEATRLLHGEETFSKQFYKKLKAASYWLNAMIDMNSGDGPNLGSNDGAFFMNIEKKPYRDFRTTLKRSLALFSGYDLKTLTEDAFMIAYEIDVKSLVPATPVQSSFFPDGGYTRLDMDCDKGHVIFRFPKYKFRPSGCDANHLDLWVQGKNITLDSGSYSYNSDDPVRQQYFGSTESHCTVHFDDHEQMPRISRMLRGHWLTPNIMRCDTTKKLLESEYQDYKGCVHNRSVIVGKRGVTITDKLSHFIDKAAVIWRLPIDDWEVSDSGVSSNDLNLRFSSSDALEIVTEVAENSKYYQHTENIFVVKVFCRVATTIVTEIEINSD